MMYTLICEKVIGAKSAAVSPRTAVRGLTAVDFDPMAFACWDSIVLG